MVLCGFDMPPSFEQAAGGDHARREQSSWSLGCSTALAFLEALDDLDFPPSRRNPSPASEPPDGGGDRDAPRLVNTEGNARASDYSSYSEGGEIVRVIVPPGVKCGQTIRVSSHDGTGRTMTAVVPRGVSPWSTFTVQFPSFPSRRRRREAPPPEPSTLLGCIGDCGGSALCAKGVIRHFEDELRLEQEVSLAEKEEEKKEDEDRGDTSWEPGGSSSSPAKVAVTATGRESPNCVVGPASELHQLPQMQVEDDDNLLDGPMSGRRVLIRVPPDAEPGSAIEVQVPDTNGGDKCIVEAVMQFTSIASTA